MQKLERLKKIILFNEKESVLTLLINLRNSKKEINTIKSFFFQMLKESIIVINLWYIDWYFNLIDIGFDLDVPNANFFPFWAKMRTFLRRHAMSVKHSHEIAKGSGIEFSPTGI